jgi:glycosyltransferase involved in cell wall biosynthesis
MSKPLYSVIIPTRNSELFLPTCLKSISKLDFSKNDVEVIIADNQSTDKTKRIANEYGCRFITVGNQPPQVCLQRNKGAEISRGEYILFIDHDMEFPRNFFKVTSRNIAKFPEVDAWSIPEKISAHDPLLTKARNFENKCAKDTVVPSFRLMKKSTFFKTPDKYDQELSGGPADWDLDIQLKAIGSKLRTLDSTYVIHHEESMTMWAYSFKKGKYVKGIEVYKKKWIKRDPSVYKSIIMKQLSPIYRLVGIYFEQNKWKQTVRNIPLYLFLIFLTIMKGSQYYLKKTYYEK